MRSNQYQWAAGFLPIQKQIAQVWLGDARYGTFFEDTKQATDLVIIQNQKLTVGLRIRRYKFIKYRHGFTLRYEYPKSDAETEYSKIIKKGFCDYLLICFATPSNDSKNGILSAVCWDMNIYRECMTRFDGRFVELATRWRCGRNRETYPNKGQDDSTLIAYQDTDFRFFRRPIIHSAYNLHQLIKPPITAIIQDDLTTPPQIALPFGRDADTSLHLAHPTHDRSHPARRTG